MRRLRAKFGVFTAVLLGAMFWVGDAAAVIGRPLTPVSGAGMARRTARRTSRRTAARVSAATAPVPVPVEVEAPPAQSEPPPVQPAPAQPAPAPAGAVSGALTQLPPGCTEIAGPAYQCGAMVYRPYYQGTDVVYVPSS